MGGDPLSVRHARLVCGIDALPFDETPLEMEGAVAQMGSCGHLLAHRRFLFALDAGGSTHAGLLGMGAVRVCVDLCHRGYHYQFHSSEGTFELGDILFHRYGPECTRSFRTADGFRITGGRHLAHN